MVLHLSPSLRALRTVNRTLRSHGIVEVSNIYHHHKVVLNFNFDDSLENCDANPGFIPTASGGNGDDVQFCGPNEHCLDSSKKLILF